MMAMDQMVDKPQNYGLAPGWSGFMQGMMTFLRVLPPDKYDEVMARIRQGAKSTRPDMPAMDMHSMPNMQHRR
jgi:manganese oxidase